MTGPQRQALYGLAFLVWVALDVALSSIGIDWLAIAFILTSLLAVLCVVIWYATRRKPDGAATKPAIQKDERDERILSRVPIYQNAAAVIALMIWLLVLTGRYDSAFDEVPAKLVFIMIWSVIIVDFVSYLVGILIAYRLAKSAFVLTAKWKAGIMAAVVILFVVDFIIFTKYAPVNRSRTCEIETRFTSTYTEVNAGIPVRFIDTSVGDATKWEWDFGDGTSSYEQNPTHTYTAPGQYTVELSVGCSSGNSVNVKEEAYVTVLPSGSP